MKPLRFTVVPVPDWLTPGAIVKLPLLLKWRNWSVAVFDVMLVAGMLELLTSWAPLTANVPCPSRVADETEPPLSVTVWLVETAMVPPPMANDLVVAVVPVTRSVPSEPPVTLPLPRAASAPTWTVPASTLRPPAKLLLLPRSTRPLPFVVRLPAPPIAPFRNRLPEPLTVRLCVSVIGVLIVTVFDELVTICGSAPPAVVWKFSALPPRVYAGAPALNVIMLMTSPPAMSLVMTAFAVAPKTSWLLALLTGTPVGDQLPVLFQLPLVLPVQVQTVTWAAAV